MSYSTTISRFARSGNGSVNYSSRAPMTLDEMRHRAPSIFAESKHASRSDRYTYVPTVDVLSRIMSEGFQPFSIMQGGSRDEAKRGFTKHLIRLRHASQSVTVGGTHNEIILINSHDGSSSYRLMAGVFRLVCGNGMVVAQNLVDDIRVTHSGNIADRVLDGCISIVERLPMVESSVREMSALSLSDGERMAFASAALIARYGEEEAPIKADKLLTVRRSEDREPTVWNTLNTVQESIIRGGAGYVQHGTNGSSYRRTRPINGIDQNTNVNRALWALGEEMARLKAQG